MDEYSCEYCGQVLFEKDSCGCVLAKNEKEKKEKFERIKETIEETFEHDSKGVRSLLELLVLAVVDGRIKNATIKIDSCVTSTIKVDAIGAITVKRCLKQTREEVI